MAKNTTLKTRIQNRHDTEANWTTASNATNPFIPLKGEAIVYDPDTTHTTPRVKIGDGITKVGNLAFVGGDISKYVTLDTAQTITGEKTFSNTAYFENGVAIKESDGTAQLGLGIDSEHNGVMEFTRDGVESHTLTLPDKNGTIATLDDIPTNYVTTDTEQTISGNKTFSKAVSVSTDSTAGFEITGGGNAWKFNARTLEGPLNIEGSGATGDNTYQFPNKTGTIALTSDIPSVPSNILTYDYTFDTTGKNLSYPLMIAENPSQSSSMTRIDEGSITFRDLDRNNYEGTTQLVVAQVNNSDPVVVSLPSFSGELALKSDIPSVDPDSLLSVIEGSNGLSVAKNTAGDKVVIQPSDPISLSLGNSAGITIGFTVKNANFAQQYARMGYAGIDIYINSVARKVIRYNKIQDIDANGTHNYVREDKLKTINGNSLYGSGDITIESGDKETKVQFGDAIQGSQLTPPGYSTVINTSTSNLQDKAITALWVGVYDGSIGHEYQIPLQDLYNFRDSSSSTAGNFSFYLDSGAQVSINIFKTSNSNITTSYNNGTLNYSIPITIVNPAGTGTVLLGFVYKGNAFSGSGTY